MQVLKTIQPKSPGAQRTRSPGASTNRPLRHYREQIVALQVDYEETNLRENLKQRGARWSRQRKLWLLKRNTVIGMGLQDRLVEGAAEQCLDVDTSWFQLSDK